MNTATAANNGRNGTNGSRQNKGGRPTKYNEAVVKKLCDALADGMPQKGACINAGISETTLAGWREQYHELNDLMERAREVARLQALRGIKNAGERDWRATESWLRLTFPADYRGNKVEVNENASSNAVVHQISSAQQQEYNDRMRKALG